MKFVFELDSQVSSVSNCKTVDEANRLFRLRSSELNILEFIKVYGNWRVYLEINEDLVFQHTVKEFWKQTTYHV